MITALQLRNGTKFSASNVSGIYRKIRNEGDKVIASQIFGESIENVGKETPIEGSTPCFILGQDNRYNDNQQHKRKSYGQQRQVRKTPPSTAVSDSISVCIVDKSENVIFSADRPSTALVSALGNSDTIKLDGKKYDVMEVALDIDDKTLYIVVE